MNWKHPSIVAISGEPYTGNTTSLAKWLATSVRFCFLIELDEILDSISPSPGSAEQQITTQAHDILCGLVETQLSLGVSVVIDSRPRSSKPLLDRLAALAEAHQDGTKFVVVNLKSTDEPPIQSLSGRGVSTMVVKVDDLVGWHRVGHAIQWLILSEDDHHLGFDDFIDG